MSELGEKLGVFTDSDSWLAIEGVPYRAIVENGKELDQEDVRKQINTWSEFDRIVLDIQIDLEPAKIARLVEQSERILWCVTPRDWHASVQRLSAIESQSPEWRDKISVVWIMEDGDQVAPDAPELDDLAQHSLKVCFGEPGPHQSGALVNGIERLVHQLRGVCIGLALGGGGARGIGE